MAFNINLKDAPTRGLRGGPGSESRGTIYQLINPDNGSHNVDFHVNVLKPGSGPGPYHYHSNSDNLYFVLEGQARVLIEGQEYLAGPGEAVFIPAGEKHDVANVGDGELRIIEVKAPAESDFIIVPHPEVRTEAEG
jgi:mannose-6-phosphate isomerase-like protein (cupin superfamily)